MLRQIDIINTSIRSFFNWWAAELSELIPKQNTNKRKPQLGVLQIRQGEIGYDIDHAEGTSTIILVQGKKNPTVLSAALESLRAARPDLKKLPIRYVLDQTEFMVWSKTRPRSAAGRLNKLAHFDALAATPLGDEQISVMVDRIKTDGDLIHTREYVAKARKLENICKVFLDAGIPVSQIAPAGTSLNFLGQGSNQIGSRLTQPLRWGLVLAACLALTISGLWARQAHILNALAAENTILETSITNLRTNNIGGLQARYDAYQRISERRRDTSSVVTNLDTLTKLIPDTAWVSEWDSDTDQIRIVGFASEAAPLVEIIETHPDFQNVRLASPISLDTTRNIEKFALEMTPLIPRADKEIGQ